MDMTALKYLGFDRSLVVHEDTSDQLHRALEAIGTPLVEADRGRGGWLVAVLYARLLQSRRKENAAKDSKPDRPANLTEIRIVSAWVHDRRCHCVKARRGGFVTHLLRHLEE
jgi:hypothetical protein